MRGLPSGTGRIYKRAFLNGRMDLTQAEAVMDVISAGSDLALKAAQTQLDGGIGAQVDELKDNLVHVLAHIEAYIDFPDEDISPDTSSDLLARLRSMEENWPPSSKLPKADACCGKASARRSPDLPTWENPAC